MKKQQKSRAKKKNKAKARRRANKKYRKQWASQFGIRPGATADFLMWLSEAPNIEIVNLREE